MISAIPTLNRLELVGETLRAALEALAAAVPDWLTTHTRPHWAERYAHRSEEYRLPKNDAERLAYCESVGADGADLLADHDGPDAPPWLGELPAVRTLRRIWDEHYRRGDSGRPRWRTSKQLPSAGETAGQPLRPGRPLEGFSKPSVGLGIQYRCAVQVIGCAQA
ncbi:hypothetical protein [Streptomyces sp. NPDC001292]|uniref:hypothetical protein n=1 Tax=Streptomyces sp. NPDC001292 TaxID=3364558 RepID=UPI0036B9A4D1